MGPRPTPTLFCAETLLSPPLLGHILCTNSKACSPQYQELLPPRLPSGLLCSLSPQSTRHIRPLVMTSPWPVSLSWSRTLRVHGAHQGLHPGSRSRGPHHPAQGRPRPVHRLLHPGVPGGLVQPPVHQPPSLGPAPTHRCRRERRRVFGRREATGLRRWGEHPGDAPLESLPAPLPQHSSF